MSDNKQPIDAAPLPWTVGDELEDFAVLDAERRVVARVASRFYNHEDGCRKAKEMAVRIAKTVNDADKTIAVLRAALAPFPSLCMWLLENAGKDALGAGIGQITPLLRQRMAAAMKALDGETT